MNQNSNLEVSKCVFPSTSVLVYGNFLTGQVKARPHLANQQQKPLFVCLEVLNDNTYGSKPFFSLTFFEDSNCSRKVRSQNSATLSFSKEKLIVREDGLTAQGIKIRFPDTNTHRVVSSLMSGCGGNGNTVASTAVSSLHRQQQPSHTANMSRQPARPQRAQEIFASVPSIRNSQIIIPGNTFKNNLSQPMKATICPGTLNEVSFKRTPAIKSPDRQFRSDQANKRINTPVLDSFSLSSNESPPSSKRAKLTKESSGLFSDLPTTLRTSTPSSILKPFKIPVAKDILDVLRDSSCLSTDVPARHHAIPDSFISSLPQSAVRKAHGFVPPVVHVPLAASVSSTSAFNSNPFAAGIKNASPGHQSLKNSQVNSLCRSPPPGSFKKYGRINNHSIGNPFPSSDLFDNTEDIYAAFKKPSISNSFSDGIGIGIGINYSNSRLRSHPVAPVAVVNLEDDGWETVPDAILNEVQRPVLIQDTPSPPMHSVYHDPATTDDGWESFEGLFEKNNRDNDDTKNDHPDSASDVTAGVDTTVHSTNTSVTATAGLFTGIRNLGNTCYLSAVIQALLSLRNFTRDMVSPFWASLLQQQQQQQHQRERPKELPSVDDSAAKRDMTFSGESCLQTISKIFSIRYHEPVHGVMDVRDFKASLDRRTHQFEGVKRQHDAHEFLVTLLALLEEDMEKSIDYSIKEQSFFPGRRDINTPAKLDTSSKSKLSLHHDAPVTSTVVAALTDININININNNNEDTYTSSRNGNTIEDSNRTSYNHLTSSSVSDSNGSHLSRILPSDLVLRSLNLVDQVTTPTATKGLDNRDSYIHGIIDASNHNSGSGCSRTTVDTTTSADTSRSLGSTSWHHDRNDNDNDNDNDDEWLMRLKRRLVPSCVPALSHFTTDVRMSFECTACKHGREPKHVLSAQLTQY